MVVGSNPTQSEGFTLFCTRANHLPPPRFFIQGTPLSDKTRAWLLQTRQTVRHILSGKDPRLLLIVGPCSIHDCDAAKEFADRLIKISKRMEDAFFFVMRTYVEKGRTSGGWKGFLYDPLCNGSSSIEEGIQRTRSLLIDLADQQIPTGAELLHPLLTPYYTDLLSWGSIGARTCTSQPHRELASLAPFPIGIKNSIDGNILAAIHGIRATQESQSFPTIDDEGHLLQVQSRGNPAPHLVLRGGEGKTNFDSYSLKEATHLLRKHHLPEQILVDCSHANARKEADRQVAVFTSVYRDFLAGSSCIRGLMLESHLYAGNQPFSSLSPLRYGVSITDPCLSWEQTEELMDWAYEQWSCKMFLPSTRS